MPPEVGCESARRSRSGRACRRSARARGTAARSAPRRSLPARPRSSCRSGAMKPIWRTRSGRRAAASSTSRQPAISRDHRLLAEHVQVRPPSARTIWGHAATWRHQERGVEPGVADEILEVAIDRVQAERGAGPVPPPLLPECRRRRAWRPARATPGSRHAGARGAPARRCRRAPRRACQASSSSEIADRAAEAQGARRRLGELEGAHAVVDAGARPRLGPRGRRRGAASPRRRRPIALEEEGLGHIDGRRRRPGAR